MRGARWSKPLGLLARGAALVALAGGPARAADDKVVEDLKATLEAVKARLERVEKQNEELRQKVGESQIAAPGDQAKPGVYERGVQAEQRQAAQPVVPEQQPARIEAVGEIAGADRADHVEHAGGGEQAGAAHLAEAVGAGVVRLWLRHGIHAMGSLTGSARSASPPGGSSAARRCD